MKRFAYVLTMLAVVTGVSSATIARADGKAPAAKMRVAVFKFDDKTDHSTSWYGGKSAGEVAYNIIDVDGAVSEAIIDKIRKIDGVLMARLIASSFFIPRTES